MGFSLGKIDVVGSKQVTAIAVIDRREILSSCFSHFFLSVSLLLLGLPLNTSFHPFCLQFVFCSKNNLLVDIQIERNTKMVPGQQNI